MSKLIGQYKNGNYNVSIYEDGTKIRETIDDNAIDFIPEFSESIDMKITNSCDMQCNFCHENSIPNGKHADINNLFGKAFLDSLHPYTEIAIGGGNPLEWPQLMFLLEELKKRNIIANMTINQLHFMKNLDYIRMLLNDKLIHGIGISFHHIDNAFMDEFKTLDNGVLHIINGVANINEIKYLIKQNIKILILGYKICRRGESNYDEHSKEIEVNKQMMRFALPQLIQKSKVVSFDNLAIKQLDVQSLLSEDIWNEFYQGDDSSISFFLDLVERKYGKNSTAIKRYHMLNSIDDMFTHIKNT